MKSAKLNIVFRAGELPPIDPGDPRITIFLDGETVVDRDGRRLTGDGIKITAKVNAKAARKASSHAGGLVLQGRLVVEQAELVLRDAGFTFMEQPTPKPATVAPSDPPAEPAGPTTPPAAKPSDTASIPPIPIPQRT